MTALSANWHLPMAMTADDPFADAPTRPTVDPHDRLRFLVRMEAKLHTQGVTCPIRDAAGTVCHACPLNHSREQSGIAQLCRLGIEQERIVTELAAARCGR